MTGKLFKYYIIAPDGGYYYLNGLGEVDKTSTKTPIRDTPAGWDTQKISYGRDRQMWGLFQGVSGALRFRGDGKRILETLYYSGAKANYNAECTILIEKRNDGPDSVWSYQTWYRGTVDFTEWVQDEDKDGLFVQVRLWQSDYKQILDVNKDKEYEIEISGSDERQVLIDGIDLRGNYNWVTGNIGNVVMVTGSGYVFPMGLEAVDSTDYFRNIIYFTSQGLEVSALSTAPNDANSFLVTNQQFQATITLSMNFFWSAFAGSDLGVVLLKKNMSNNSVSVEHTFFASGPIGGTLINSTFTDTLTYTFDPYPFRYFISFVPNLSGSYTIDVDSASMNITFDKALPSTTTTAFRYRDYVKKMVERVFDGALTLQSNYLGVIEASNAEIAYKYRGLIPNRLFITSGDGIRQLATPKIKGTLSALMKDLYSRYMCGCAIIGDKFVVEPLSNFLQGYLVAAEIYDPINIKKETAKDLLFNKIKVGYPEFRANDLNGRFEVNSQQEYELSLKSVNETLDLTTEYKAAPYEIEFLRSSLFGQETRDNDNDNSIYLLYCEKISNGSGQFPVQKYDGTSIDGVPNPATLYNVVLSPHRMAERHIPYLKSVLNIRNTEVNANNPVKFISADRNANMQTYLLGVIEKENADILPAIVPQSAAQNKLFMPLTVTFECKPQNGMLEMIMINPYSALRVHHKNTFFDCFIMDIEISGAENDSYKFTTLLAPEQDTSQFIS